MKKLIKTFSIILTVCILFSVFIYTGVNAATGTVSVTASSSSVKPGDSFTVTVKYEGTDRIGSAKIVVSYDASLVSCDSGSDGVLTVAGGPQSGSDVMTSYSASYTFTAKAAGNASFSVSSYEVVTYDLPPSYIEATTSGTSVSITAPAAATATPVPTAKPTAVPTPAPTPKPTAKATPVPTPTNKATAAPTATAAVEATPDPLEVVAESTVLTIATKPENVVLPAGFIEAVYTYKSTDVWAAVNTSSNTLILYLEDSKGEKSGFYVYDEMLDEFSKYIVMFTSNNSYTVLSLPEGVEVPEGFIDKVADLDGVSATVWVPESYRYVEIENCDFYLVYAMNASGETGFYLFDTVEETFQRYNSHFSNITETTPSPDQSTNVSTDPDEAVNPDDEEHSVGFWQEFGNLFGRIFGGKASAYDWGVFSSLILVLVLIIVVIIFIIYAVQKHKEEKEDDDFPLAHKDENITLKKNEFFTFEDSIDTDEISEELPETYEEPVDEDVVLEEETSEEAVAEEELSQTNEEPVDDSVQEEIIPQEIPEEVTSDINEKTEIDEVQAEEDKKKDELFNFTFENTTASSEPSWNFDEEIGEDFFNED